MFTWENRINSLFVNFSTVIGIASGLLAFINGLSEGKITTPIIIYLACFLIFLSPQIYLFIRNLKFRKYTEEKFIKSLDFSKVRKIKVLSHTGRILYAKIGEKLDELRKENKKIPEEIHVLTRTRFVESTDRNEYIKSTISRVHSLREQEGITPENVGDERIDIRFYECLPSIRGIVCEDYKGRIINFTAAYYWEKENISKKFDYAFIIRESTTQRKEQGKLLNSWFSHYWGRDEIHTIVFDFDDTLIPSMDLQINAWLGVINKKYIADKKFISKLKPRLGQYVNENDDELLDNRNFREEIRQIFIEQQLAEAIIEEIFIDISDAELEDINNDRFEIRKDLLLNGNVRPFDGVEKKLQELHEFHNFAIITSTDEKMVRQYLQKRKLVKYFSVILGKNDLSLRYERENIHKKAFLLIKLSEMIGIPLDRMIYIGDNNTDYLATRQIGIDFIEAQLAANLIGKTSLIEGSERKRKLPIGEFQNYTTDELNDIIKSRSLYRKLAKY